MASEAKRLKVDDGAGSLKIFLQWCDRVDLILSDKVFLSNEGTVAAYGMLANEDIEEGEILFTIPRSALLHQGTSKVSALLEQDKASLQNLSGWVPLLLALLYEYTSPESYWRPYLSLWPDFSVLDQPMFWCEDERRTLLKGTGIPEAVETDLSKIRREYADVVLPYIRQHPDLWSPGTHTLELYTRLVAFVMAYSFQEPPDENDEDEDDEDESCPNPPMMVPMADMLNHVSNHNANLEYTPDRLKMVCVRPIRKGEEVFNTYGPMANWQLLHMYGFTEPYPSNSNDTADIPLANVFKAAKQGIKSDSDQQLMAEKWGMLCEMVGEKQAIIFGKQGCLTDAELHTTLKLLCMSEKAFREYRENEGWEEDGDDEDEEISLAFSYDGLPGLKAEWRHLIHMAACTTLGCCSAEGVQHDQALILDTAAFAALNCRQQRALQVRHGQNTILSRVMELTKS